MSRSVGSTASDAAKLLARARRLWREATLLCITHDVGETRAFDRVLVVEGGQIVEDGAPADLAKRPGSRYRALLEAERRCGRGFGRVAPGAGGGLWMEYWSRTNGRKIIDRALDILSTLKDGDS